MITQNVLKVIYITDLQKRITLVVKFLKRKRSIDKATFKNIKRVGNISAILCG